MNAEPLEKSDVGEVFVSGFASTHTMHTVTAPNALPKERANSSASVEQPKRLNAAERREIHDHLRLLSVSGNTGGKFERR